MKDFARNYKSMEERTFNNIKTTMDQFIQYVGQAVLLFPSKAGIIAQKASVIRNLYSENYLNFAVDSLGKRNLSELANYIKTANDLFDRIYELNSLVSSQDSLNGKK